MFALRFMRQRLVGDIYFYLVIAHEQMPQLFRARIQEFLSGGAGAQVSLTKISSDNIFFFFFFFLVLSLFYRSQMVNFKEIYHFSRFQRGSNILQGGPTFSRVGPIAYSL